MILGSVTLSDDIRLDGLENAPRIVVNQRRTITGESAVQWAGNQGGRILTLVAFRDNDSVYGYFTQAQVDAIGVLFAAGAAVTMTHHRGTFNMLITAVDVESLVGVADPAVDAVYVGTVTGIEM